jgi:hypothetical protein
MALAQLNTAIPWPGWVLWIVNVPQIATAVTLDAAGEYHSVIFCAREAMTISHVGWRCGAATGSPTADIRIETVDTAGLPSGTLWAANTNIVTGALTANATTLFALTASASIAAGQMFCVKIAYNSGTSFIVQRFSNVTPNLGVPYVVNNTGAPAKAGLNGLILALGSSTTAFYCVPGAFPLTTTTNTAFNNTNGARRGLRFQTPFNCRAVGVRFYGRSNNADFNAAMFDDAGTELSSSSTAFDGDQLANLDASGVYEVYFDNPVTLSPGTWYRAALEPSSATNMNISHYTLPDSNYRSAWPGGTNHHLTTYASGAWTDTATADIPAIEIMIDQLDDGIITPMPTYQIGI